MLEFKRVFNLCKKLYLFENIDQDGDYKAMMEVYIDEYFKKKIKECNNFLSYEQRLDHLKDLVDFYTMICDSGKNNLTFHVIAQIVRDRVNEKRSKEGRQKLKTFRFRRQDNVKASKIIHKFVNI